VAGGTTTHYVYGLGGLLSGEYDNAGVLIREYVWLNGAPLAQIDKSGGTETVTYLHTDHLATPRYGTNAAGSTVWTWDSGAFGKEAPTGTATVNLRFPGQYYDAETTLHYNWNRYYNPATGRYVSSDPIGLAGGFATYNYVSASPVMFADPRGLDEGDFTADCLFWLCSKHVSGKDRNLKNTTPGDYMNPGTYEGPNGEPLQAFKNYGNDPGMVTNCLGLFLTGGAVWIEGEYGIVDPYFEALGYEKLQDDGKYKPGDGILWDTGTVYNHIAQITSVGLDDETTIVRQDYGGESGIVYETLAQVKKRFPNDDIWIVRKK
jgi:RHS repeat-associated protein